MALYIVSTPIGNLEDITLRALKILKTTEIIIVESYLDSSKLLKHFNITPKKIIKYNDRNKNKQISLIIKLLKISDASFITSAGTPAISDPGSDLVSSCVKEGIDVYPIPGVSALTTALSISGMSSKRIIFLKFLPRQKNKILKLFNKYLEKDSIISFFESPYRIRKTLEIIKHHYPDTNLLVAREMTKKFESYYRGNAEQILKTLSQNKKIQGEFTILIQKNI